MNSVDRNISSNAVSFQAAPFPYIKWGQAVRDIQIRELQKGLESFNRVYEETQPHLRQKDVRRIIKPTIKKIKQMVEKMRFSTAKDILDSPETVDMSGRKKDSFSRFMELMGYRQVSLEHFDKLSNMKLPNIGKNKRNHI